MDPQTIASARAGDETAMERVLAEVAPAVRRFGLRMCRNDADADEVLQDTLLAITQNLPSYEARASLTSWVFTLARTACARRRRGLKNRAFLAEDAAPEPVDERPSPEEAAVRREVQAQIIRAIDSLPEKLREVLELRDVEGLTANEAAASLGVGTEAVKSRLHRARAALRAAVSGLEKDDEVPAAGCPDVVTAMSAKLEGDLAESDCAAMERHVATCARCDAACRTLRSALASCRSYAAEPVPAYVQDRVRDAVRAWSSSRAPR